MARERPWLVTQRLIDSFFFPDYTSAMQRRFRFVVILLFLFAQLRAAFPVWAQEGGEEAFVAGLLPKMSPEAKVGQLFMVGFNGSTVTANSGIADLIRNDQVGGVVLSTENGNIVNDTTTPVQVATLTSQLQNLTRAARTPAGAPFIPLFTALRQDGDGTPNSEILSGLTPAPSYMALGATWNAGDTEAVGKTVGQELAALGINFLLGPVLDVRTEPSTAAVDPGVDVFGGDPYWVGVHGQSYARGLQAGSQGHLAVAARHFPGQGALNDASFTLDRSLEDLTNVDLPPFERALLSPTGKGRPLADVLLASNVRYRGFSGNVRERTAPVSVDSAVLKTLLDQPSIKAWRDNGGLLVSDAPGSLIVRDYYSTTGSAPVSATQIALDAFQAGNDLLILDNLAPNADENAARIRAVIDSFRQKYSTDPAFQARVDNAVQRILRLKYRMYPNYDPATVIVQPNRVAPSVNTNAGVEQKTAADALTLLWPHPEHLTPARPSPEDLFLIATDTREYKACLTCPVEPTLQSDDLAQSINLLYGVPTANISTTTFSDLKAFLTNQPNAPDLAPAFQQATWVVLAMQGIDPAYPASDAAQLLLDLRPNLVENKHLIGFMFGPPYGLSATEMGRFTALYSLYGKLRPNVDAALRALTGESVPPGRAPVSISALGYDLTKQTEPDPLQVIQLAVGDEAVPGQPTPAPARLRVGDTARIHTGVIVDRNGNPVPDGTPVQFIFQYDTDSAPTIQNEATLNGVARTEYVLDKVGRLLIRATSEPARNSVTVQITTGQGIAVVATLEPTPIPTNTPMPLRTSTPGPTPTLTPTPEPDFWEVLLTQKPQRALWGEWALGLLGVLVIGGGGFLTMRARQTDRSRALRVALWCASGGLVGYLWLGAGLPGSDLLHSVFGAGASLVAGLLGGAAPLLYWLRKDVPV